MKTTHVVFVASILAALSNAAVADDMGNQYGSAHIQVVSLNCSVSSDAQIHAQPLQAGESLDRVAKVHNSAIAIEKLMPGRYSMYIKSGTCSARFYASVFPSIERHLVSFMRESTRSREDEDVFVVPYDAMALKLPFRYLDVHAEMLDGKPVAIQVDGQYAFIDNIGEGTLVVTVAGSNFSVEKRFKTRGSNMVLLREITAGEASIFQR